MPARVLLVDDDPFVGRALARMLRGRQVAVASDAAAALALLEAGGTFDLLLIDVHLSSDNGLALIAAVRARYPQLAPRVVVVTGDETLADALRARGERVLDKPWDVDRLRALVDEGAV